jgi:hypothetical protein
MTGPDLDPDLERLGDALRASTTIDLAREERATRPARRTRPRRRVLAGSTLGLAGVGAALVLVLSAGGAAAPPAFAVTKQDDGSVLVNLSYLGGQTIPQVNQKLAAMGAHEQFSIDSGTGPATVPGPVTCTRTPSASGPQVKVLVGKDGTEVIGPGQSGDNTAEGTWHIAACHLTGDNGSGNTGAVPPTSTITSPGPIAVPVKPGNGGNAGNS